MWQLRTGIGHVWLVGSLGWSDRCISVTVCSCIFISQPAGSGIDFHLPRLRSPAEGDLEPLVETPSPLADTQFLSSWTRPCAPRCPKCRARVPSTRRTALAAQQWGGDFQSTGCAARPPGGTSQLPWTASLLTARLARPAGHTIIALACSRSRPSSHKPCSQARALAPW